MEYRRPGLHIKMKFRPLALLPILILLGLAACLPAAAESLPPEPTLTSLPPTETATPTVVWFPPTATYTPIPAPTVVITPTVDVRPDFGQIIFNDSLTEAGEWSTVQNTTGSVAVSKGDLTIAIQEPGGYLYSVRQSPDLKDFYVEVTASANLCRGLDEYGLLLRYNQKTEEFYRFSLTCNGQTRLDKYTGGRASSPQDLMFHGAVPPGAPSSSRLAVWARGKELNFYANGAHLFTVSDPTLSSGSLGVFARSNGENSVTINFSDIAVYEVDP